MGRRGVRNNEGGRRSGPSPITKPAGAKISHPNLDSRGPPAMRACRSRSAGDSDSPRAQWGEEPVTVDAIVEMTLAFASRSIKAAEIVGDAARARPGRLKQVHGRNWVHSRVRIVMKRSPSAVGHRERRARRMIDAPGADAQHAKAACFGAAAH